MDSSPGTGYDSVRSIGELYDAVRPYRERTDVPFYVEEAVAAGGGVLEVGCGTGRILIPIARKGVSITGIDGSPAMLARCRGQVSSEPEEVRRRVTLHEADMRDFDLGESFATAIIPFRPFQHLIETGDQLSTLRAIYEHLDPGGRLIFDVFNPDLSRIASGPTDETEDTSQTLLPDGRTFRRTGRVKAVHAVDQTLLAELIYYVTLNDVTERLVHAFAMRWFTRFEVEHLLGRAGFSLEAIYGNFDRSALVDGSPEMVFIAERR